MDETSEIVLPIPSSKEANLTPNISSYTDVQRQFINEHFGITPDEGKILVTRSQIDKTLPTAKRSCCIVSPLGQGSFYDLQGFVFSISPESIPWVKNGDAGTPITTNSITNPDDSMTLEEYLAGDNYKRKYTETMVDFEFGKADHLKAVYDFRTLPKEPNKLLKFINPNKYKDILRDRKYLLVSRNEWRIAAEKYGVPLITELPDLKIMKQIREEEIRTNNLPEVPLFTPLTTV